MKTTIDFLLHLRGLGIKVWMDGELLRIKAPPKVLTPDLRKKMTSRKVEIMDYLRRAVKGADRDPIPKAARTAEIPLSHNQESLWILEQMAEDHRAYHLVEAFQLWGSLDGVALETAISEIFQRHEILRTTFPTNGGTAYQHVNCHVAVSLPLVDLSGLEAVSRERERAWLVNAQAAAPFDLAAGPLARKALLREERSRHVLAVALHHIVADGWSIAVLVRELRAWYEACLRKKRSSPAPALTIQYADFAIWQRARCNETVMKEQIRYWQKTLANAPRLLELPTDKSRPPVPSFAGATIPFKIPGDLSVALKDWGHSRGASLFMALESAFVTLLQRYSGQDDLVVGTVAANRDRAELEPMIGFFVNTLVHRLDMSGDPSIADLVERVRATALAAQKHGDLPFNRLVEILQPERRPGHSPLFQVMFAFQNSPAAAMRFSGLQLEPIAPQTITAKFDLMLVMDETGSSGWFEYSTDLFESQTIRQMITHFQTIIGNLTQNSGQPITSLNMMPAEERRHVLEKWHQTGRDYPHGQTIHRIFESQVQRNPDTVALVTHPSNSPLTVHTSYAYLNHRARLISSALSEQGVILETPVAIMMERNTALAEGILGVLMAGGVYVPLDSEHPKERLSFMIAEVDAPVILTRSLRDAAGLEGQARAIVPPGPEKEGFYREWEHLSGPENLAYIMFTSGSTGKPKGVCVPHRAVTRLVFGLDCLSPEQPPTLLHMAPPTFDAATFELWGALLHGGRCVLFPDRIPTVARLESALCRQQIDTLWLTASLFNYVVDEAPQTLKPLGQLLIGGEALSVPHVRRAFRHLPEIRIINGYGPTEGTTFTCCYAIPANLPEHAVSIPIGRPINNTHAYVLDSRLEPVPVGLPGELFIGGDGLARGYLTAPASNATRFLPDVFSAEPGKRWYWTGDRVRYLDGGLIAFLGRADDQVKIRGFRIEPGEIAAVLAGCPDVREAVVLVREDRPGEKRLTAYLIPEHPGAKLDHRQLRDFLSNRLPDYMLPAEFMVLPKMPLTANGKVDRRALPVPRIGDTADGKGYESPRDPTEELLAGLWSEVLGVQQPGATDSFFELGGHSLQATRTISRVREVFSVDLPLRSLFEGPTIRAMAARIRATRAKHSAGGLPPIRREPRSGEERPGPPLSFGQERLWFLDRLDAGNSAYHIPLRLGLRGPLARLGLQEALAEVVRRHEILRTHFPNEQEQAYQKIQPPNGGRLSVLDLSGWDRATLAALTQSLGEVQARHPFDLARGPLWRATLFVLSPREHWLCLTLHHIITDGWSLGVMIRETSAAYTTFFMRKAPLPALTIQYADYARWQRRYLDVPALKGQHDFWCQCLEGAPTCMNLPLDRPRSAARSFLGRGYSFTLEASLTEGLKRLARSSGATLFIAVEAIFALLLSRYSQQKDIVIGTPVANRNRSELEPLIGFFVNTLALRHHWQNFPTMREFLDQARQIALEAYDHQDLPFEKVVEAVQPDRNLNHAPIFQVMFVLQNTPREIPRFPGLDLIPDEGENGASPVKFDLTLRMEETPAGLSARFEYDAQLFDPTTVIRMTHRLRILAAAAVRCPESRINDLPWMDTRERYQILVAWNDTRAEMTQRPLHRAFAEQAARTPDAPAAMFKDRTLSFQALNIRAGCLAAKLRRRGVGPEVFVALSLPRSRDLLTGWLAVLKSGGAYLPLDPAYPAERLRFMLADSQAPLLITSTKIAENLPAHGAEVICLDGNQLEKDDVAVDCDPHHPAYAIYTSGSTGKPKAVVATHGSVFNLARALESRHSTGTHLRIGLNGSLSFDTSVKQLVRLLWGHGIDIVPQETRLDGKKLAAFLSRRKPDLLDCTPTQLEMMCAAGWPPRGAGCPKVILVGGEAVQPLLWRAIQGGSRLFLNLYGPTECTVDATLSRIDHLESGPHIGRPLANIQCHVVDSGLNPLPTGIAGELAIAGAGLARGYLGRAATTAEKFVPNPFPLAGTHLGGTRLYRSGDKVRFLPSGAIAFIGRLDNQIKLRGFRVELGEIETALGAHPQLDNCAVLAHEERPGDLRLVAYVASKTTLPPAELSDFLGERLPEYMIPSAFVFMETLPMTPNGKLDREALPAPAPHAAHEAYEMPTTPTEEIMAAIWAEVLGRDRVGRNDGFFELGGHSLLATRVLARVCATFSVELGLNRLFRHAKLSAFSHIVDEAVRSGENIHLPPLEPRPAGGQIPLSFAQQRLWFLDKLEAQSPAYHLLYAVHLEGRLHTLALEHSLNEIRRRHEVLRTVFPTREGTPVQAVEPFRIRHLSLIDCRGLETNGWRDRVRDLATQLVSRPFDLAAGPLLRLQLLCLADDDYLLLMTMHHIISDAWSLSIMIHELRVHYPYAAEGGEGHAPSLAELPIQYADYATWQRNWLSSDVLAQRLIFWRELLDGAPALLELPTDYPRPPVQTFSGDRIDFQLGAGLSQGLSQLSLRTGNTLFISLQAAFSLLLSRYSGQDDIVLGTTVANRTRRETEPLLGLFANTLVLRTQMRDVLNFTALRDQVRRRALEAFSRQDVPFEQIVDAVKPERNLSYAPLFQVMFFLQNAPRENLSLPLLRLSHLNLPHHRSRFDLTLAMTETKRGIHGSLEYNRDLFCATTVRRMAGHFHGLLTEILHDPGRSLERYSFMSSTERQQMLIQWNDTDTNVEKGCLHHWFAFRAAREPEAVVTRMAQTPLGEASERPPSPSHWTYAALEDRASCLAASMQSWGAGRGTPVAVCLERSPAMMATLLAIFKVGGFYVPLDPAYPQAHLDFMLKDSRAPLLLTREGLGSRFAPHEGRVVLLEREWEAASPAVESGARVEVVDHGAYLIYTSGSTGRPKGAMGTHLGMLNRFQWMWRRFPFRAREVGCQKTSLSFLDSCWEMFGPTLQGIPTVIIADATVKDPHLLTTTLARHQVSRIVLVPSLLGALLDSVTDLGKRLPRLTSWVTSGEALGPELAARFHKAMSHARLINLYGASEVSADVTCHVVGAQGQFRIPIGRPIANTRIYLLDPCGRPCPMGLPGELFVAGTSLAGGYSHRPRLTAEKFMPNPFTAALAGARLYRTGDRARFQHDGVVEYLGRNDRQVKIRGFRIELGSIEAALGAHPLVRECCVVVREDRPGDRRLFAYVVAQEPLADLAARLKAHLRQKLPDYMVPAAFVSLDVLPLLSNGKVDRQALPMPGDLREQLESSFVPPETQIEQRIATIWREVLGVEKVGIHDNFFDAGGNSLLFIRVNDRLKQVLQRDIPMVKMFQFPTIGGLAGYLQPGLNPDSAGEKATEKQQHPYETIAVIGMAGRFPDAPNLAAFWQRLRHGHEAIRLLEDEALREAGVGEESLHHPRYVKACPLLPDYDLFDASFFGFSAREAEMMDPQQRLFLEAAWEALEHGAYDPLNTQQTVGVFAGADLSSYAFHNLLPHEELARGGDFRFVLANDKDYLATRTSYKLNLKGPSINVQTACSTSLVAVAMACESLRNGDCDMALAGGVSVRVPQKAGYFYEEGMITSPDGHCRAFDARAGGTVFGSGVGVVLLKPRQTALADGDPIHALIKGWALNNDGSDKAGFTAPSIHGQVGVITKALRRAGLSGDTISYVEAHGTGTEMGDPIEIEALTQAFRQTTDRVGFCALASVKTNIGHLGSAAGIAGLLKTVLALKHQEIPPSLNFENPNPKIDFAKSPFYVNTQAAAWQSEAPRRAGVSSFGIGGTNAHVVLEEAPASQDLETADSNQLWVLSAKTAAALDRTARNLADFLETHPDLDPASVAHTLRSGRSVFPHRRYVVGALPDVASNLRQSSSAAVNHVKTESPAVVFMFPGQGAQAAGMGAELYRSEPVFRTEVDRCSEIMAGFAGFDPRADLFPSEDRMAAAGRRMRETATAQPALFIVSYALAHWFMARSLRPKAMIGHSVGEYVAACLAGIFTLEDALRLVYERGRLMQSLPPGAMLALPLSENDALTVLTSNSDLAAVNAPDRTVVSGTAAAIEALQKTLKEKGTPGAHLYTSHAFHSSMMDPILTPYANCVAGVKRQAPKIPIISNLTGDWLRTEEAVDPHYWVEHLRRTVRFSRGLELLMNHANPLLLEVGPGRILTGYAKRIHSRAPAFPSLLPSGTTGAERAAFLETVGRLWIHGVSLDLAGMDTRAHPQRCALPTYPFERKRYWIDPPKRTAFSLVAESKFHQGLFTFNWKRDPSPDHRLQLDAPVWIFADDQGVGTTCARALHDQGVACLTVEPGDLFEGAGPYRYRIRPHEQEDYQRLVAVTAKANGRPGVILHFWSLSEPSSRASTERSYVSLLHLAEALGQSGDRGNTNIAVVTQAMFEVTAEEKGPSSSAVVLGAISYLSGTPCVFPYLVDLALPLSDSRSLLFQILTKPPPHAPIPTIAWRGRHRWVPFWEPMTAGNLPESGPVGSMGRMKREGVYLVTGGLQDLSYALAFHLAKTLHARLVLLRNPPTEKTENVWQERLAQLEGLGADIMVLDTKEKGNLELILQEAKSRFGPLDGLIHAPVPPMTSGSENDWLAWGEATELVQQFEQLTDPPDLLVLNTIATRDDKDPAWAAIHAFYDQIANQTRAREQVHAVSILWDKAWDPNHVNGLARVSELFSQILESGLSQVWVEASALNLELKPQGEPEYLTKVHPRPELNSQYVAPRTETERLIAEIWKDALGIERVGIDDDFLEMGGDSVLAAQIIARLNLVFEVELPVAKLLENPTIAAAADYLENVRWAALTPPPALEPAAATAQEEGEI